MYKYIMVRINEMARLDENNMEKNNEVKNCHMKDYV